MNALARCFRSSALPSLIASVLLVGTASATTYVVDANGGFDFTDIQSAIDASSIGDVILVHPGTYAGFTMSSAISIIGGESVETDDILVTGIGDGPRAAISSMRFRSLTVTACTRPVLFNDVTASGHVPFGSAVIDIEYCADVRLLNATASAPVGRMAAVIFNARVEITRTFLAGGHGTDDPTGFGTGGNGTLGVLCDGTSDMHISLSTIAGGRGGDSESLQDFGGYGGNGAVGLRVWGPAKALITGRASDLIVGGRAGYGSSCSHNGDPGIGMWVAGTSHVRSSGATIQGGAFGCGSGTASAVLGVVDFVTPIDPSLQLSGDTSPGQVLTFVLRGTPGDSARIRLGRQAIVQHQDGVFEDLLTNPLRIYDLGTLPASGEATKHVTIPGSLPDGYLMVFQGSTVGTDGITRLTQSAPVIVK